MFGLQHFSCSLLFLSYLKKILHAVFSGVGFLSTTLMTCTLFKFIYSILLGNGPLGYILMQKYDDHGDWANLDDTTTFTL